MAIPQPSYATRGTRTANRNNRSDLTGAQPSFLPSSFSSVVNAALTSRTPAATTTGQNGNNSSTTPTVIVSPFNPLGLPICTTPAPTAAEVAANPQAWAGTSFDPNIAVKPVVRMHGWDE